MEIGDQVKFPVMKGKNVIYLEGIIIGWDDRAGERIARVKTEHDGIWQCSIDNLVIVGH